MEEVDDEGSHRSSRHHDRSPRRTEGASSTSIDSSSARDRLRETLAFITAAGFSEELAMKTCVAVHTYTVGVAALEMSGEVDDATRRVVRRCSRAGV
jgi:hypothetical protein